MLGRIVAVLMCSFMLASSFHIPSSAAQMHHSAPHQMREHAHQRNTHTRTAASLDAVGDETEAKQLIKALVSENDVMVFSKSTCPFCARTKALFSSLDTPFRVVEVNERPDGPIIQQTLLTLTGQRTVPSVWVKGKHIGGNDGMTLICVCVCVCEMIGLGLAYVRTQTRSAPMRMVPSRRCSRTRRTARAMLGGRAV